MAKSSKKSPPPPLNPSVPAHTHRYFQQLRKTGVHGTTISEVARTLIYDQIKYLLKKGALRWEYDEGDDEDSGRDTN